MTIHYFNDSYYSESNTVTELKEKLGGKGANLNLMMTKMELPVPPGMTLTANECVRYMEQPSEAKRRQHVKKLVDEVVNNMMYDMGDNLGRRFGNAYKPMLVSVRSGARVSMPGMMDTILNLGLNDETVLGLAKMTNEAFAYDSQRRFLQMYGTIVLGIPPHAFEHILSAAKAFLADDVIPLEVNMLLIDKFKQITKEYGGVPDDTTKQLYGAVRAVWESWNSDRAKAYRAKEGIPDNWGTAVNIQTMVFGNMNDRSGTGVVFSRNPNTGEDNLYGDFLINAQGEDVVSGTHDTMPIDAMNGSFPDQFIELQDHIASMEGYFGDMVDVEFTIEDDKLWILQCRSGKRGTKASIRIALDMVKEGLATSDVMAEKLMSIVNSVPASGTKDVEGLELIGKGLAAAEGIAVGEAVFSAEEAAVLGKEKDIVLITLMTSPNDIEGMGESKGILTLTGGTVSHAAVVARGWGIPCVVSLSDASLTHEGLHVGGKLIRKGDLIKINGETGEVFA